MNLSRDKSRTSKKKKQSKKTQLTKGTSHTKSCVLPIEDPSTQMGVYPRIVKISEVKNNTCKIIIAHQ